MNYYLQCKCSENSRQKVRCSGRHSRQNESWLSVCAVMAWRKNLTEIVHSFLSSDVAAEVDRWGSSAYLVGQYDQLVVYMLMDRKPVQLF